MKSIVIAALAALSINAVWAQAAAPCAIVVSQGKNISNTDPKVNEMWNKLNGVLSGFVAEELVAAGKRAVQLPLPVEAGDGTANTDRVLRRAQAEGCDQIVTVSMFADQDRKKFVSQLQMLPIVVTRRESPPGTSYIVGAVAFTKEQLDPLTVETLDKLAPSQVARTLVQAWREQGGK